METVRIYRLNGLALSTRERLRAAQLEAARVWNVCRELQQAARLELQPWPDRHALQRARHPQSQAPPQQKPGAVSAQAGALRTGLTPLSAPPAR